MCTPGSESRWICLRNIFTNFRFVNSKHCLGELKAHGFPLFTEVPYAKFTYPDKEIIAFFKYLYNNVVIASKYCDKDKNTDYKIFKANSS